MWPVQEDLIQFAPPPPAIVLVNHHVNFSTGKTERVIFVHAVAFARYDISDRAAEAYAMVSLFESGYANQKNIARAFGVSARSLCRYQERLEAGGLAALARADGRPSASRSDQPEKRERDRTILHLKAKGFSNRAIAGKLGLDEKAMRKRLHLLGWAPCPEPSFAFPAESGIPAEFDTDASGPSQKNIAGSVAKKRERYPMPNWSRRC
ncbi:MAG: helix-turn-helix domain-containing protein [Acidobacteriota bacterium]